MSFAKKKNAMKKINKLEKPKNDKTKKISYWANKADKLLQEIGREMYQDDGCLVCSGEYSCLHHYILKSHSTLLRYDWKNLIPICAKCHNNHHQYKNSTIHAQIDVIKGIDWVKEILALKNKELGINTGYVYYREMYNKLLLLKPYKCKNQ